MTPREEELLRSIVAGVELPRRTAGNPLENSYWANLLRGAAKALSLVATLSLEWKLVAIAKLFQSWLDDKEAEQRAQQMKTEWGYNYELTHQDSSEPLDQWGGRTYY